ncbi:MAG: cupredoxin domain-containing protein [Patescibacteria group bacterium]|jgi:plastocyanin
MKNKNLNLLIYLVIIIAGLWLAYSNLNKNPVPMPSPTPNTFDRVTSSPNPSSISTNSPSSASSPSPSASTIVYENQVTFSKDGFSPATISVSKNQTVHFVNSSSNELNLSSNPNPTNTDYLPLNIGIITVGSSADVSFSKTGTFGYYNRYNPAQTGKVVVR